ncbi:MAG: SDR family NAD(P)-dependent oxidoreductase [Sphingomonadaceae bacterium]|nr:SDR family NAD(P)-dependent oxidoreductase [Sphingomonadaceae bacterium]
MTDRPFEGRLALVTGASRGIGAATAKALAAKGAHVVLVARTAGGLEEVEEAIHGAGGSATIAPLDLTESDSIARLASAIGGRWQALDMLVLNAAALGTLTPVPMVDQKEFGRVITLNLLATQALIAGFDAMLRKSAAARVIGLTTSVATRPRAYWGVYGATKAAMESLLLSYGEEVKDISAIRVALVNPGATATKMRALAYPGEDQATLKSPDVVGAALAALVERDFENGFRLKVEA